MLTKDADKKILDIIKSLKQSVTKMVKNKASSSDISNAFEQLKQLLLEDQNQRQAYIDNQISIKNQEMLNLVMNLNNSFQCSLLNVRKHLIADQNVSDIKPIPEPYENYGLDESLNKLRQIVPKACELWELCQEEGEKSYLDAPESNLSVEGHAEAWKFQYFALPFLKGNVLDIGCGMQELPVYLKDYPIEHIAGVDPLGEREGHPFMFHKGLAEYLPWPDETFATVMVSTSLDHMILLDQCLSEIKRVLTQDGTLLIWAGYVPGSKPYNPYDQNLQRIDKCHIFHLDRGWFEELIQKEYVIHEIHQTFYPQYNKDLGCFYALKKR